MNWEADVDVMSSLVVPKEHLSDCFIQKYVPMLTSFHGGLLTNREGECLEIAAATDSPSAISVDTFLSMLEPDGIDAIKQNPIPPKCPGRVFSGTITFTEEYITQLGESIPSGWKIQWPQAKVRMFLSSTLPIRIHLYPILYLKGDGTIEQGRKLTDKYSKTLLQELSDALMRLKQKGYEIQHVAQWD